MGVTKYSGGSPDMSAYISGVNEFSPGADAATPATYHPDTEVRYRDALDNSQISDSFTADVQVIPRPASGSLVRIIPITAVVAVVVIGAGYYLLVKRKKN